MNPIPMHLRRLRSGLRTGAERAGAAFGNHPRTALALLLMFYLLAQLGYSLAAPLWHDELFTFYIAQAPSLGRMWDEIRRVDLNPPLSYLLTRACFDLFGVGTLQCRLPEIGGFALALVSLYVFVRRRSGAAFGLMAAALFFASRAGELVMQARPYGLMLGFSALALACWQAASNEGTPRLWLARAGLCGALAALLLTHVFGLLAWAALVCGEAAQSLQRRRLALGRWLALAAPLLVTSLYGPLLSNHAQSAFPSSFQPTGYDIFLFYMGHIDRELITLWLSAVCMVALGGRSWLRPVAGFALIWPEWIAVSGFLAAPLLLIGYLMLSGGAFFDRYGVIACIGTAALFTTIFEWWSGGRAIAALVAAALALLITGRLPDAVGFALHGRIFRHSEPVVQPLDTALLRDARIPLVTASGLTFVEMQRRESPALVQRTFYLTDTPSALSLAHATIFEGMAEEVALFGLRGHVEPFGRFTRDHPSFYVLGTYDYPEDWLLRKLQQSGARIRVLGRLEGSYKDHELYEVHLAP